MVSVPSLVNQSPLPPLPPLPPMPQPPLSQPPSLGPLPIPRYMPLKGAEAVLQKNLHLIKKESIGRLVTKLARYTYFGEDVLSRSCVSGTTDKHPLDPQKLYEMKRFLKSKFPQESPTEFETTWAKCIDSLNRLCSYLKGK